MDVDEGNPTKEVDWTFEGQGYQGLNDVYVKPISQLPFYPLIIS